MLIVDWICMTHRFMMAHRFTISRFIIELDRIVSLWFSVVYGFWICLCFWIYNSFLILIVFNNLEEIIWNILSLFWLRKWWTRPVEESVVVALKMKLIMCCVNNYLHWSLSWSYCLWRRTYRRVFVNFWNYCWNDWIYWRLFFGFYRWKKNLLLNNSWRIMECWRRRMVIMKFGCLS